MWLALVIYLKRYIFDIYSFSVAYYVIRLLMNAYLSIRILILIYEIKQSSHTLSEKRHKNCHWGSTFFKRLTFVPYLALNSAHSYLKGTYFTLSVGLHIRI